MYYKVIGLLYIYFGECSLVCPFVLCRKSYLESKTVSFSVDTTGRCSVCIYKNMVGSTDLMVTLMGDLKMHWCISPQYDDGFIRLIGF